MVLHLVLGKEDLVTDHCLSSFRNIIWTCIPDFSQSSSHVSEDLARSNLHRLFCSSRTCHPYLFSRGCRNADPPAESVGLTSPAKPAWSHAVGGCHFIFLFLKCHGMFLQDMLGLAQQGLLGWVLGPGCDFSVISSADNVGVTNPDREAQTRQATKRHMSSLISKYLLLPNQPGGMARSRDPSIQNQFVPAQEKATIPGNMRIHLATSGGGRCRLHCGSIQYRYYNYYAPKCACVRTIIVRYAAVKAYL